MTETLKIKKLEGRNRFGLLELLEGKTDLTGIELGVAGGDYSAKMVASGKFAQFFGVDMYADTHDTEQYKSALKNVGIFNHYKLLRMTFDEALDLFPDETFDFMYLDGYAGSGLEGGTTIRAWASKVKIGGVLAGDDYHEHCHLLQRIVNEFCEQNDFELLVTEGAFDNSAYGNYPSWAVVKNKLVVGQTSADFQKQGLQSSANSRKKKLRAKKWDDTVKRLVSEDQYNRLREWNSKRRQKRQMRKKGFDKLQ